MITESNLILDCHNTLPQKKAVEFLWVQGIFPILEEMALNSLKEAEGCRHVKAFVGKKKPRKVGK